MSGSANSSYVSYIKINGVPILPPLITPELRKQLLKYKQQAIKVEQRVKKQLEENEITRPSSQLTFGDNSHIEALNIVDKIKVEKDFTKLNLSRDIIEVTQYDDNGMKTICSNITLPCNRNNCGEKTLCDSNKTDQNKCNDAEGATDCNIVINEQIIVDDGNESQCVENECQKSPVPPKPRLIRSNSYTLECPSPILLAHLKKSSIEMKPVDFNNLSSARNWTSLENNHTPYESSDFGSIDTVYYNESCDRNSNKGEVGGISPNKPSKIINEIKSPTIEVYQTDISVQQITVNTSAENSLTKEEKSEKFLSKNPFDVFEPDGELLNVLKDIPEVYANQIIELLRVQHVEQKERLERYNNLSGSPEKLSSNSEMFRSQSSSEKVSKDEAQESRHSNPSTPIKMSSTCVTSNSKEIPVVPAAKENDIFDRSYNIESCSNSDKSCSEKLRRSSTFSMSPSQSLYYSITSDVESLTAPSTPSVKLIDLESNNMGELEVGVLREKNGYWEGVMIHHNTKNLNCSKELFPQIDPVTLNVIKKEWAASIIGAHVKGYLTRRLLKTEKVQSLIATIKDVLMCAVDLHHSDNIDEKDVELHRRLINQLSAALYSFHEIFFDVSIPEQMLIIAADRHRKLEKLKRPQSGRSLSRPTSSKSTSSSRSNKSLPSNRPSSKHKFLSGSPSLTKV